MTRAAIYVRVSTTKDSQKDSPEHQIAACKHWAEDMGWETADHLVYEDRESGTTITDRLAIQQVVKDAQRGAFQAIIFAALSRFARDIGDSVSLKRKLVDALGIRLISIDDHYDSDRDGELLFSIISSINQSISEQISRSTRRGKRESALKGNFTGSRPPYGYDREVRDGRKALVPNEEQQAVVQTIFRLYTANRMGEKAIAAYLNRKGIAAPKGGNWGTTTVQRILQNEAYVGKNRSSKYTTKKIYTNVHDTSERKTVQVQKPRSEWRYAHKVTTHQGIIEEQTFRLAEKIRLERGGGRRGGARQKVNVFAGLLACRHCGSAIVSVKSAGRRSGLGPAERAYRYLVCSRRRRQGETGCVNSLWLPYEPFKAEIVAACSRLLRQMATAEALLEKHEELIQTGGAEIEAEIKKVTKMVADNRHYLFALRKEIVAGKLVDERQYALEKAACEQEIAQGEQRLDRLREELCRQADGTDLRGHAAQALDDLLHLRFDRVDEMQLILKRLILGMTVDRDGCVEVAATFELPPG